MKFENIIKSLMIAGLLAGVSDANAAKPTAGKEEKVGQDIHCPKVTLINESRTKGTDTAWTMQVGYQKCGDPASAKPTWVKVDPNQSVPPINVNKDSGIIVDEMIPGTSRSPQVWSIGQVINDAQITCDQTYNNPKCHID